VFSLFYHAGRGAYNWVLVPLWDLEEEERRPSWTWWRDEAEEAAALACGVRRWRR
jgi:hypothetical protein